jgi:acyl-CoA thioesterase-2
MSRSEASNYLPPRARGSEPRTGAAALAELVELLEVDETSPDTFVGESCSRSLPFVFGGQVAAQSLAAAYRTVPGWARVHSLHSYFVRAGDPAEPIEFGVTRIRDGRSFIARQIVASQGDQPIFTASMSFTGAASGIEHADPAGAAAGLDPDALPARDQLLGPHRDDLPDWWSGPMAVDVRFVDEPPHIVSTSRDVRRHQQLWMRAEDKLSDDMRVHDCVFTFASDLTLLDPVVLAHGLSWYAGDVKAASLDHSIWFHRPFRIDEWVLYEQRTPAAHEGRGLAVGSIFTRDGTLVASVAQEGLIRQVGG